MATFSEEVFVEVAASLAYFGGVASADKVYEIIKGGGCSEELAQRVRTRYLQYVEYAEGRGSNGN